MSGSIRFPTYLPTVSDRGGRQQRGGEQREVAQRKGRTTEEAGKIHLFIPALSVKSPVQFPLSARLSFSWFQLLPPSLPPCLSHFVLLSPKPLIPLLLPHTHSLILKLFFSTSPLSIVLPVPLCYSPPPSSFCLSHLNMPPLSITPLHTPDDCSTPYVFFSIFFPAFFCFVFVAPFVVFAIIYASSFAPHHHLFVVPGLVFECVAAPSTRLPDSDVSITVNVRIN